jgi:hypothetical protein
MARSAQRTSRTATARGTYEDGLVHNKKGEHAVREVIDLLESTRALEANADGRPAAGIAIGLGTPDKLDLESFAHLAKKLAALASKHDGLAVADN